MIIEGKTIYHGIAIGRLSVYHRKDHAVQRLHVLDVEGEVRRFEAARVEARDQLTALYDKALGEIGEIDAAILAVHRAILDDHGYEETICNGIRRQEVNAEYVIATTADHYARMFAAMDDEYIRSRAADIRDVSDRLIRILQGDGSQMPYQEEPVILLADDLAPSEAIQLDRSKILALVTRGGSPLSHTAILARTFNIPALIGVDYPEQMDGHLGIVDGYVGQLLIDPSNEVLEEYHARKDAEDVQSRRLQALRGQENVTLDGHHIELHANISIVEEAAAALANDADGIGLFRSEFLYLGSADYPSEEVQFDAYRRVAEAMGDRRVVIRTLDIGADKQVDYFHLGHEDNPAMGYRAIRICLGRPEVFKAQLRAIYRASAYGNIAVMFPMITSLGEVQEIKRIIGEVQASLDAEHIPYRNCEIGVMIETPAAAMLSYELAQEVDFLSVGTNDLTQYMLAIDRQNARLDRYYDSHHPAVLRMLQMIADNAHRAGCPVGICGELGADTTLTETLIRMGYDELSVSPTMVLRVREQIRQSRYQTGEKDD